MKKGIFLFLMILLCVSIYSGCGGGGEDEINNGGEETPTTATPMDLTDNGDGTVTDNINGLKWQQDVDLPAYNWYEAAGLEDDILNPDGIIDVCGDLTLAGFTDWRLPTAHELMTLVKYEAYDPAMDTNVFPDVIFTRYWSFSHSGSWIATIKSSSGEFHRSEKSAGYLVRCVSGETLESLDFSDMGDGTIAESTTRLMWQKESGPALTFSDAEPYCNDLSLGGYEDWRLPEIWELTTLIDYGDSIPVFNSTFFPDTHISDYPPFYYSQTRCFFGGNMNEYSRWTVNFKYGATHKGGSKGAIHYCRCVRDMVIED